MSTEKVPKMPEIVVICSKCQRPCGEEGNNVDRTSGKPVCNECKK